MAHASVARLRVLHAIRIKGFPGDTAIATAADLSVDEVRPLLDDLAVSGAAMFRDGRLTGWTLTAEGRAQHAKAMADELDTCRCREEIDSAYREFLDVNADLLGVCTDWQLKPSAGAAELNDHRDPAYDAAVVERLRAIDTRVQPVVARLAAALERFAAYSPRLAHAVERVEAGDIEWFTTPLTDSYHTVWFELHEDLLATLGIERSKEEQ